MPALPSPSAALRDNYHSLLLENVIPFWLRHGIDEKHGGVFTCLRDDGSRISGDKYLWSQGRAVWTFAALHNRIAPDDRLLAIARRTADFILRYGRDEEGAVLFRLTREGAPLEPAISAYADYFVAYGLGELYRATGEERLREEALTIFRRAARVTRDPEFERFAPYARPPGIRRMHGPVMLGLEVAQELADIAPEPDVRDFSDWCLDRIMNRHLAAGDPWLLEHLGPDDCFRDTPEGRAIVPGHAIESLWFVLHQACRRQDPLLAQRALDAIRFHLEAGWDPEFGGIFLGVDCHGGIPWWPNAEKKLWWPHTEAIYALLLAHTLTDASWPLEWLDRIQRWAFEKFPDREHGEWRQRLDRSGRPISTLVALPVKDPFHLPRTLILAISLLDGKSALPVGQLATQSRLEKAQ